MFKTIKTAVLSAVVGLTTLTGMAASAQAEGLYLNYGSRYDPRVGVYVGGSSSRYVDDRDYGRWGRNSWDRDHWRRGCSPERALNKAEWLGLHRARVVDIDRRSIDVAGRHHGRRIVMTFARAPHCPIIR